MPRTIELQEHRIGLVSPAMLTEDEGTVLFQNFGDRIDVQFPSPRTDGRWALASRGFVGALSVGQDMTIVIRPKLPVANIARMLQCAYDLPLETFPELVPCHTVPDLYEQLVRALLLRVRGILRQGIHQRYRRSECDLAAARGRIRIADHLRRPARLSLPCAYEERTPDVVENRVLLWTLDRVLHANLADNDLQHAARSAHRELQSTVALVPFDPRAVDAIVYDRLTMRYEQAHRLCRLLLEAAGPVPEEGTSRSVPFLLDMPRLFERFVARWLAVMLPSEFELRTQERNFVGDSDQVEFLIDLVIYELGGGPLCVLDTKYKTDGAPSASDVAQVGYYALLKRCPLAGLVYPRRVPQEWQGASGTVATFRTTFDLAAEINSAGGRFLEDLERRLRSLGTQSSHYDVQAIANARAMA
jgi:5-methylcytosine-specific restriction enzyme subunit McrC